MGTYSVNINRHLSSIIINGTCHGKRILKNNESRSLQSKSLQHKMPSNRCGGHWSSDITLKTDVKCHNRRDSMRHLNIADIGLGCV